MARPEATRGARAARCWLVRPAVALEPLRRRARAASRRSRGRIGAGLASEAGERTADRVRRRTGRMAALAAAVMQPICCRSCGFVARVVVWPLRISRAVVRLPRIDREPAFGARGYGPSGGLSRASCLRRMRRVDSRDLVVVVDLPAAERAERLDAVPGGSRPGRGSGQRRAARRPGSGSPGRQARASAAEAWTPPRTRKSRSAAFRLRAATLLVGSALQRCRAPVK